MYDVTIIGAGPAGYTAAIYTARAGLKSVLYKGMQPGGQLTLTTDVENYPGYPNGVLGPKMMEDFEVQTKRFGTEIKNGSVTKVDFTNYPYQLKIENDETITSKTIIIATGAEARKLGIPNELSLYGKGISSCATCDGFFFKDQEIAIVGGGDSAAEEALYLSKICKKVYLLVRKDHMRASHYMQEKVKARKNITILWNTIITKIIGTESLEALEITDHRNKKKNKLEVKGLFVAIGHNPNTKLFEGALDLTTNGYIKVEPRSTQTNLKGVFAAGDVQDPTYRQAITAAGTGCMAALDAERFLNL